MPPTDSRRLAIIGAGPVGLEAALQARRAGLDVTIYEQGRVGEFVRRWGHVRLFSPFAMNSTAAGRAAIREQFPDHTFPDDDACITGRDYVEAYLEPLAQTELIQGCLQTETEVVRIGRQRWLKHELVGDRKRAAEPFRLLVRHQGAERIDEADLVFDCSGTYGRHRWLGEGGIPAVGELDCQADIVYGLEDLGGRLKKHYAGRIVMVVGGGYSAATSVTALAALADEHPETGIIWLTRTTATQPLRRILRDPLKERDRLAVRANSLATRGEGNVEYHGGCHVQAVEKIDDGFLVTARDGHHVRTWEVDRLIANVGYTPDAELYRELQVHECYATLGPMRLAATLLAEDAGDCLKHVSHGSATLANPEPNFYILGAKSYGRNSQFLMRLGFQQVAEAMSAILG